MTMHKRCIPHGSIVRFDEIERTSARGLRRFGTPGVVVYIGRRAALGELWMDAEGSPVTRFSTAKVRHWFILRSTRRLKWRSLTADQWGDLLGDRVASWLAEVIDEDFE